MSLFGSMLWISILSLHLELFCSLHSGALELGYSTSTHGMFPRGGTDLALHFYRSSNKKLFDKLSQELQEIEDGEDGKVKKSTGKFVRDALEDRIRSVHKYCSDNCAVNVLFANLIHLI